jgi:hypothetical protein
MMHVVGYETSGSEAALTAITPIPDGIVQIQSNDILVPDKVNNVGFVMVMINSAAATLRAQLTSPSLKAVVPLDISPINNGLVWGSLPRVMNMADAPLPMVVAEPMDLMIQNGGAVMNRGFVTFMDGPWKPITGKSYSLRFTTSITLVTASWVNGALTFGTALPAGNYQVVGMRMWSANGVYARLFFKGSFFRPGAPMLNAEDNNEWPFFRSGNSGVWDQFNNVTPPSLDIMGITDSAQVGYLDVIKV